MRRRRVAGITVLIVLAVLLLVLTLLPGPIGRVVFAQPRFALQQAPGPLEQMLAQVTYGPESRTVIWYGSLADYEALLGIKIASPDDFKKLSQQQQIAYLLDVSSKQIYYSAFSGIDHPVEWQQAFGINPFAVERELTVGAAPDWYAILQGQFSSDAITQALTASGYKPTSASNQNIFSLGADNAVPGGPLGQLADSRYDRLIVSNNQIVAAPSTALIQTAAGGSGGAITKDPNYVALVRALESPATIPDTQLISAALFGGPFLSDKVITNDPLAASVGKTLSADQVNQLRSQLAVQNEKLLPRYTTAAIGYRRSAKARYLLIALVYTDPNAAAQASSILAERLPRYSSFTQQGRQLFQGWAVNAKVSPSDDQKYQVVTVSMQLPAQTDVAWTQLIMQRDIGFLAAQKQ